MASLSTRIARGAAAGVAGSLAMDLVWYVRYRRGGGESRFSEWDVATTDSFDEASAPGKVGQRLAGAIGLELPDEAAGTTTNVVHWLTGVGYGIGHGLLQHRRGAIAGGLTTGVGAFVNSYASLGALGIYDPIWEYDRDTLVKDLSAHLVFGLTAGLVYRALDGR